MVEFDQTRIAIRERSYTDILDLAVRVSRRHALPLIMALALGVIPATLFNAWLLGDIVDNAVDSAVVPEDYAGFLFGYGFLLTMLLVLETPLVTALATLYLGEALHVEHPRFGPLLWQWLGSLRQLFILQGIVRAMMTPWVITWLPLYVLWPYLNEVILLERNRLWARRAGAASTLRRTSTLHGRNGGELFGRWIGALTVGGMGILSLWLSIWYVRGMLTNRWEFDRSIYLIYLQAAVWIWVGFFTVVRFLSYLDLRIRNEGWEIELMTRAEGRRLTGQAA